MSKRPIAECDCCGEVRLLTQVWYLGYQETWACDKCRGIMDDPEYEYEDRMEERR